MYSFQTHDSKEHLAMMERVLGPMPTHMLQKTRQVYTLTLTACYHSLVHGVSVCVCILLQVIIIVIVFPQETPIRPSRQTRLGRALLVRTIRSETLQTSQSERLYYVIYSFC